ncbi:MAG: hypothetical protein JOZ15_02585 [Acidobacteria bacterium]|nr:hypothetical protein [Acidobacteriota bacterium]
MAGTTAVGTASVGTASVGTAAVGTVATGTDGGAEARDLLPYQRLFRTLDGEDQRLFREMQEGLLEAENVRSSSRRWPAPAALAAQGVPPFADAPGRGGRRLYRWQLRQRGPIVNYLGLPADARDPALLLLVQEPDPQALAAGQGAGTLAQATDEVHHRLADGTLLHVSTWMRAAPAPQGAPAAVAGAPAAAAGPAVASSSRDPNAPSGDPALIAEPYARGWVQLLAGTAPR